MAQGQKNVKKATVRDRLQKIKDEAYYNNMCRDRAEILVEKAVPSKKIFSVIGSFPAISNALISRGWVERLPPFPKEKNSEEEKIHHFASKMVYLEQASFIWTKRRNYLYKITRNQRVNHFSNTTAFTTKSGLCMTLKKASSLSGIDIATYFPRCYYIMFKSDYKAFIRDYKRTACIGVLRCVVERDQAERTQGSRFKSEMENHPTSVPSKIIDLAIKWCEKFLISAKFYTRAKALEVEHVLTKAEWTEFLTYYYDAVHGDVAIQNSAQYVKQCSNLLKLYRNYTQYSIDGTQNMWIIKPGNQADGNDIECAKQLDKILELMSKNPKPKPHNNWLVQKYIERPYLISGTKIDVKQWFLVTKWDPLTIWHYKEGYVSFSSQPFSLKNMDRSVHLCNLTLQNDQDPSQEHQEGIPKEQIWSCEDFKSFLFKQNLGNMWNRKVVPQMKKAVIDVLQASKDRVQSFQGKCFELFGVDFVLGEDLHPWLIEINSNAPDNLNTVTKARICTALLEDTIRVVLDRRSDPNAFTGDFEIMEVETTGRISGRIFLCRPVPVVTNRTKAYKHGLIQLLAVSATCKMAHLSQETQQQATRESLLTRQQKQPDKKKRTKQQKFAWDRRVQETFRLGNLSLEKDTDSKMFQFKPSPPPTVISTGFNKTAGNLQVVLPESWKSWRLSLDADPQIKASKTLGTEEQIKLGSYCKTEIILQLENSKYLLPVMCRSWIPSSEKYQMKWLIKKAVPGKKLDLGNESKALYVVPR